MYDRMDRLQRVVDLAARFGGYNAERPVTEELVARVTGCDPATADEVARLVNSRLADPFAGLGRWSE